MEDSALRAYVTTLRQTFHQHPELGFQEFETSRRVREELTSLGLPIQSCCGTGVVAELTGTVPGRRVLLRADMDALPMTEETGLPFASICPGVMHACGHDAHTAMLLGAAKLLAEQREQLKGSVRFLFEPAEEFGGAGLKLIEEGVLEGVDAVFGLHVSGGLPCGKVNVQAGPRMAGCDGFSVTLQGVAGHGSAPHLTVDVIPALAAVLLSLQTVVSREIDPADSAVLSVGTVQAGTASNIIPGEAALTGTLRYFRPEVGQTLRAALERVVQHTASAFRVEHQITWRMGLPPVVNDPAVTAIAARSACAVLGEQALVEDAAAIGSDDFACYLQKVPGVYAFLGISNPEKGITYSCHHPKFDLDEDALSSGSRLHAQFALDYLNAHSN